MFSRIEFHIYRVLSLWKVSNLLTGPLCLTDIPQGIVCSIPLSKSGNKGSGKLKKIFWVGKTKRGGKILKKKGGNPTLQVKFRDRKGQNWGLLEIN